MWFGAVTEDGDIVGESGWFPARFVEVDATDIREVKTKGKARQLSEWEPGR